jgi:transposase
MVRDHEKAALARSMRSEGVLLREIAEALEVSAATVSLRVRGVLPHNRRPCDPRKITMLPTLARMYQEGRSIPEIAASTGIPATTLYDWRRELELPRNSRSAYVTSEMRELSRKQFSRDPDGALKVEEARLYCEGMTTPEIALRFDVHSATICAWLRSTGVTPRRSPTLATREKLRVANLGAKRWNWKGGVTPDRIRLRISLDMKLARECCFKRDNYTCRSCGQYGGKLNAHHIWPFQRFPEWKYKVWNLLTLCRRCHDAFHKAASGHVRVAIGPFFSTTNEVREAPAGSRYPIAA